MADRALLRFRCLALGCGVWIPEEDQVPKRVNNGPGDDPDEYWFECDDCEGTGSATIGGECAGCGGLGFYEGDADDVEPCNKRFHPKGGGPDPGSYWYFCGPVTGSV